MNLHEEIEKFGLEAPLTGGEMMASVVKRSLVFPLTSLPALMAIGSTMIASFVGWGGFFSTSALWFGAAASVSFGYNLVFRRKKHLEKTIFRHVKMQGLSRRRMLAALQRHFLRHGSAGEEKELREQAAKQLRMSMEKYEALRNVLASRFLKTELTYDRYLGAATEVFHHIIDHLNRVLELLNAIESIDVKHIQQRVAYLESQASLKAADEKELVTLHKRLETCQKQWSSLSSLLTENEESLTAFSDTIAALNAVDVSQKERAKVSSTSAMNDLKSLAERAKTLNRPG
jgi:hypothetical protein